MYAVLFCLDWEFNWLSPSQFMCQKWTSTGRCLSRCVLCSHKVNCIELLYFEPVFTLPIAAWRGNAIVMFTVSSRFSARQKKRYQKQQRIRFRGHFDRSDRSIGRKQLRSAGNSPGRWDSKHQEIYSSSCHYCNCCSLSCSLPTTVRTIKHRQRNFALSPSLRSGGPCAIMNLL